MTVGRTGRVHRATTKLFQPSGITALQRSMCQGCSVGGLSLSSHTRPFVALPRWAARTRHGPTRGRSPTLVQSPCARSRSPATRKSETRH